MGPTGVGKTAVAMALAVRLGVRVISCDSMQVYQGFRVLTNQPTAAEIQAVPHELVGFVEPTRTFSAGEYVAVAHPLVEEDVSAHGVALVSGGTGLYMRALLAPLEMAPRGDQAIRRRLETRLAEEGLQALCDELRRCDPAAAEAVDELNPRRVLRALEAIEATGRSWSGRDDLWHPAYYRPTLIVALALDREQLYRRIDARAEEIVTGGGVDEVRRFLEERERASSPHPDGESAGPKVGGDAGIYCAIGFREIARYLSGEQSREQTVSQVAAATRRYARRQSTWLRKLRDAVIIDVRDRKAEEVAARIYALVQSGEQTREPRRP